MQIGVGRQHGCAIYPDPAQQIEVNFNPVLAFFSDVVQRCA
jgi:hypothetical protein